MSTTTMLNKILANTYSLYLKTQNYHWHIKGPSFYSDHLLLEKQYTELATAIDTIAERIITLQGEAVATFSQLIEHSSLKEGDNKQSSREMLHELAQDHATIIKQLQQAAQDLPSEDEGSLALISERVSEHEKTAWMLRASST